MKRSTNLPHRRHILTGAAAIAGASGSARAASSSQRNPLALWYDRPAAQWVEALPLGNGRLGAMVFGGVAQEQLQLNEDTLWAGAPYNPVNPEALSALPKVRALIADGKFKEAEALAQSHMMAKPLKQMPYGTLGDIFLTFSDPLIPESYLRTLALDTAISTTTYTDLTGEFSRETFTTPVDQVVVVRLTAKGAKASLDLDIDYRSPGPGHYISWDYQGPATVPNDGAPDWLARASKVPLGSDVTLVPDGDGSFLVTGRNEASNGIAAGLTYALRVAVVSDGKIVFANSALQVRGAKSVTLFVAAATSYVNFSDTSGEPVSVVRQQTRAAVQRAFADVRTDHIRAHQALFNRVKLDLGETSRRRNDTRKRIIDLPKADDPQLSALYFNSARYLMISSSREGSQASNLQGIWNEGTNPPWDSKYTININTEMNYWPAEPAALGECTEPLVRLVEDLAITGAKTAKEMYGARGWMAHHNTDLWRATAPIDGVFWGMWPTGGAWLCKALWDHYDYQRQTLFLERIYPILHGASQFYLDVMIEDPAGRGLITSPSTSPENPHPFGTSLCAGPAMDRQIIRDLFANTLQAADVLGLDTGFREELAHARSRIAPDRIGALGQLQEWLEDWDGAAPEQAHRHVSHLYAVYPSDQINIRDTPELLRAAKRSLETRGDIATGWGTAWRACLWARMGEGDHAHAVLQGLIGPQRTYPNMFDACPPFQIDGNFGGSAAIIEMLLQSWGGELLVLPALPSAWPSGSVTGLKARGGLTVDMVWRRGQLDSLGLNGPPNARVRLRYQGKLIPIDLNANGRYTTRNL